MKTLAERSLRVAMSGVVPSDDPSIIADMQAEIEWLRELLRHADNVIIWEHHFGVRQGFQEEIEEALGIGAVEQQESGNS